MTAADDTLRTAVEELLGREAVAVTDRGRVVARPDRTAEVAELMRWARRESVVVRTPPRRWLDRRKPYPGAGELLLQLDRLRGSVMLDRVSNVASVPAGITGAELCWRLHREGRWVRPRPLPFYTEPLSTYLAGPGLASEATALTMWESPLMAIEAVLGDGRVLRAGVAPRSAAGPDYRTFLLGTGDRMGVITSVTWRTDRRTVPLLFAAQMPRNGAGFAVIAEHVRAGWRPWSSTLIRGADATAWNRPQSFGDDGETVLLCHRAEGDRAALLRRQLGAAVEAEGGEVLDPSAARSWFEGAFLSWCKKGAAGAEEAADDPAALMAATAWIAAPWPALATLWRTRLSGTGFKAVPQLEGLRPEGGLLRLRLMGGAATAGRLAKARRGLAQICGDGGARLVGFVAADGESIPPMSADDPATVLLEDMAVELGSPVNPPLATGKGA